ncbi:MAG: DUF4390 domain-containing protein [Xanthomonadales bacterium]|nr:DUF4390 domain-containing protein [Xanthomonadales bacterium]
MSFRSHWIAIVLLLLLPGAARGGSLRVAELQRVAAERVQMRLQVDLEGAPAQALEHGITLPLVIQRRHCVQGSCNAPLPGIYLQVRYAPLQERYLLEHQDQPARGFAFRPSLLDAMENPPAIMVPAGAGWELRVRLRVRHLPPPLRLPARLEEEWRLDTGWVAVP